MRCIPRNQDKKPKNCYGYPFITQEELEHYKNLLRNNYELDDVFQDEFEWYDRMKTNYNLPQHFKPCFNSNSRCFEFQSHKDLVFGKIQKWGPITQEENDEYVRIAQRQKFLGIHILAPQEYLKQLTTKYGINQSVVIDLKTGSFEPSRYTGGCTSDYN